MHTNDSDATRIRPSRPASAAATVRMYGLRGVLQ